MCVNLKEYLMLLLKMNNRTLNDIKFIQEKDEKNTITLEKYLARLEEVTKNKANFNRWDYYNIIGTDFVIVPYSIEDCEGWESNWLEFIDLR